LKQLFYLLNIRRSAAIRFDKNNLAGFTKSGVPFVSLLITNFRISRNEVKGMVKLGLFRHNIVMT